MGTGEEDINRLIVDKAIKDLKRIKANLKAKQEEEQNG